MSAALLALIETVDRHGNVQLRLPVTQWPVTVGRDLAADLVLDDAYVAAQHLRLEQTAAGRLRVEVLDTCNGASVGAQQHARHTQFDWIPGQLLTLGRTHLQLRLADTPAAAEQALQQGHWRSTAWTLFAVTATLLLSLGQLWFKSIADNDFTNSAPAALMYILVGLAIWAGLWALLTKLFTGQAQFWKHVRIACAIILASFCIETVLEVLAFMFSWETLVKFDSLAGLAVLAAGAWQHLLVVAPKRRRALAGTVSVLLLLGIATMLGTQWLKNKRLSSQLYMNRLYPSSWRLATPVAVPQFLQEAGSIEQRLKARLDDKKNEDDAPGSGSDDDD